MVAVFADEIDVTGLHQLQQLRLLPQLRAGILIDQHGTLAQLLELGREHVIGNAIARIELLVVGEAIMLHFLRIRAHGKHCRSHRQSDKKLGSQSHGFPLFDILRGSNHWGRGIVN